MHVHVYIPNSPSYLVGNRDYGAVFLNYSLWSGICLDTKGTKEMLLQQPFSHSFLRTLVWQKSCAPSTCSPNLNFKSTTKLNKLAWVKESWLSPKLSLSVSTSFETRIKSPAWCLSQEGPQKWSLTTSMAAVCFNGAGLELDFFAWISLYVSIYNMCFINIYTSECSSKACGRVGSRMIWVI